MHVTVLMSVYNQSRFVQDAVQSILGQSYKDWDMLIVDDASTDGTWEMLQTIPEKDARIVVRKNDRNLGLAASLNSGCRQALGSLLARMDADDVSLPERLGRQVEYMQAHPEVSVLGTAAEILDESGRYVGSVFRPAGHEILVSRIYKKNPFLHPTVMMRRAFVEALGGYDERLRRGQDYDLWLRGYRTFRYANLQEVLVRYRARRAPSWNTLLWGMYVLGRSGLKNGHLAAAGWGAFRYGVATAVRKIAVRRSCP